MSLTAAATALCVGLVALGCAGPESVRLEPELPEDAQGPAPGADEEMAAVLERAVELTGA
ncbi:hypothetical protein [Nocardiopsis metallicus]|uniref:Uncharacterized protein n=1 Tax=Nocardiopsis metallicus TaxID=179819 RepID=A0A840WJC7_9ACTN|nr:hypothetical protein [Nocardiopsis metallicus]MBB5491787.1 hypothetical protein [Nocardiopsis metallicus]